MPEPITGYLHPLYAESLAEFGQPQPLAEAGGWMLVRQIPVSPHRDAMGCYPILACRDWSRLHFDLNELRGTLVSLTAVADPFGRFAFSDLELCFDVVTTYKQHFVADLSISGDRLVRPRHKRNLAKALRRVDVEVCADPSAHLDEWVELYSDLVARHRISGLRAFSRAAFERQLRVPGLIMLRATAKGQLVGLHQWYIQGDVAYGHLGATSPLGYRLMASYALYAFAIDFFRGRVAWLDLGASAGPFNTTGNDGLAWFKAGWSSGVRPAFLCGRILDSGAYLALVERHEVATTTAYFPAYRSSEAGLVDADPSFRGNRDV